MKHHKRRRSATPPEDMRVPFRKSHKRLKTVDFSDTSGFVGRYLRRKKEWLVIGRHVSRQVVDCWLFADGKRVGFATLWEFKVKPFLDDDDFWWFMDSISNTTMELAQHLITAWPEVNSTLGLFGSIILIEGLWVHPDYAKRSEWAGVIRHVLETELAGGAIWTLKAFPLEDDLRAPLRPGWKRRRKALMRIYRRRLGVRPFPGEPGRNGWMYAVRNKEIPKPKR